MYSERWAKDITNCIGDSLSAGTYKICYEVNDNPDLVILCASEGHIRNEMNIYKRMQDKGIRTPKIYYIGEGYFIMHRYPYHSKDFGPFTEYEKYLSNKTIISATRLTNILLRLHLEIEDFQFVLDYDGTFYPIDPLAFGPGDPYFVKDRICKLVLQAYEKIGKTPNKTWQNQRLP